MGLKMVLHNSESKSAKNQIFLFGEGLGPIPALNTESKSAKTNFPISGGGVREGW